LKFTTKWRCEPPSLGDCLTRGPGERRDPNSPSGLTRMSQTQIDGMRMLGEGSTRGNRITWFLEGMPHQHSRDCASPMDLEQPG
jgi:hypothetical protein